MGQYKPAAGYGECQDCISDHTSNVDRTACDVCKYHT